MRLSGGHTAARRDRCVADAPEMGRKTSSGLAGRRSVRGRMNKVLALSQAADRISREHDYVRPVRH